MHRSEHTAFMALLYCLIKSKSITQQDADAIESLLNFNKDDKDKSISSS